MAWVCVRRLMLSLHGGIAFHVPGPVLKLEKMYE